MRNILDHRWLLRLPRRASTGGGGIAGLAPQLALALLARSARLRGNHVIADRHLLHRHGLNQIGSGDAV